MTLTAFRIPMDTERCVGYEEDYYEAVDVLKGLENNDPMRKSVEAKIERLKEVIYYASNLSEQPSESTAWELSVLQEIKADAMPSIGQRLMVSHLYGHVLTAHDISKDSWNAHGINRGFLMFIVFKKVLGEALTCRALCRIGKETRAQVRSAF
jgi:hypothetical protein